VSAEDRKKIIGVIKALNTGLFDFEKASQAPEVS
jgi:hypothetical protein